VDLSCKVELQNDYMLLSMPVRYLSTLNYHFVLEPEERKFKLDGGFYTASSVEEKVRTTDAKKARNTEGG
jgi:hypothetical protein